jgi:hypothetical protein
LLSLRLCGFDFVFVLQCLKIAFFLLCVFSAASAVDLDFWQLWQLWQSRAESQTVQSGQPEAGDHVTLVETQFLLLFRA